MKWRRVVEIHDADGAMSDREIFVRENATALLADRDALIERQRKRITQLEDAVRGHRKERRRAEQRIAVLERQLRERP